MTAVLVTGGAGYIGSHVALALKDKGYAPVILDDLSSGRADQLPKDIPFVKGDVGNAALVASTLQHHGITAVMHCAGSISVAESMLDPLQYYANNTAKTAQLLQACVAGGITQIIFSSTAAVYGQARSTEPLKEDDPQAPLSPYGWSKWMTERMLADLVQARPDIRYGALRFFNVAGADPHGRLGQTSTKPSIHLIKILCEVLAGRKPSITVNGTDYPTPDGTCIRDYVHVSDLAQAHVLMLEYLAGGGTSQAVNCGSRTGFSVREVIAAAERLYPEANIWSKVLTGPRRRGDPPFLVADPGRLHRLTGWQTRHTLDDMIRTALAWENKLSN